MVSIMEIECSVLFYLNCNASLNVGEIILGSNVVGQSEKTLKKLRIKLC